MDYEGWGWSVVPVTFKYSTSDTTWEAKWSAVLVSDTGWFVSAGHGFVRPAESKVVRLAVAWPDGSTSEDWQWINWTNYPDPDFGVFHIRGIPQSAKPIALASVAPRRRATVWVMGYPKRYGGYRLDEPGQVLKTDFEHRYFVFSLEPQVGGNLAGLSGGAIVTNEGRLLGVFAGEHQSRMRDLVGSEPPYEGVFVMGWERLRDDYGRPHAGKVAAAKAEVRGMAARDQKSDVPLAIQTWVVNLSQGQREWAERAEAHVGDRLQFRTDIHARTPLPLAAVKLQNAIYGPVERIEHAWIRLPEGDYSLSVSDPTDLEVPLSELNPGLAGKTLHGTAYVVVQVVAGEPRGIVIRRDPASTLAFPHVETGLSVRNEALEQLMERQLSRQPSGFLGGIITSVSDQAEAALLVRKMQRLNAALEENKKRIQTLVEVNKLQGQLHQADLARSIEEQRIALQRLTVERDAQQLALEMREMLEVRPKEQALKLKKIELETARLQHEIEELQRIPEPPAENRPPLRRPLDPSEVVRRILSTIDDLDRALKLVDGRFSERDPVMAEAMKQEIQEHVRQIWRQYMTEQLDQSDEDEEGSDDNDAS